MAAMRRLTALAMVVAAAVNAAELRWSDLGPLVTGRKVSTRLAGGRKANGKVLAVLPEGLRVETKSGETLWPRAEVSQLRVSKTTKHWRVIGTAIGAGGGAPLAGVLHAYLSNEGASSPLVALAVIVPGAIGYLAGWAADRKNLDIRITPEP